MRSEDEWHTWLTQTARLAPDAALKLREIGFIVLPGPTGGGPAQMRAAYDRAVAEADPADVHVGRTKSSTRINNLVNRGPEFDSIYTHMPLLAACREVIGHPFRLSGMRARTLHPGAHNEKLHVDVRHRADGWPLLGCILMVDDFTPANGATRFVPRTHLQSLPPEDAMDDPAKEHESEVLACGQAGSLVIFNASVWHGHGANRTHEPRRSIQAHFVARKFQSSSDHSGRMRIETLERLSELARYVLDV
jgi:ectoine hydroxylase-related dioxygenase (phytanoyl-CoA dioxygenase family)